MCALGSIDWGEVREGWKEQYPVLAGWLEESDGREVFRDTWPVMFDLREDLV